MSISRSFRVDDYVCLVTGAGSGIGRATALTLAEAGAARIILVGRTSAKLEAVAKDIKAHSPSCETETVAGDITQRTTQDTIRQSVGHSGRLDLLVNNAGVFTANSLANTNDDTWQAQMNANLTAPFALSRDLLPFLERAASPVIVNISSTLAVKPIPNAAAYNAAKGGLVQLSRSLALELAPHIRVNCILPAVIETPMYEGRYADRDAYNQGLAAAAKLHPLGRVGQPADIARAVLFLASPAASWMTGVALPVDGGMLCT